MRRIKKIKIGSLFGFVSFSVNFQEWGGGEGGEDYVVVI